MAKDKPKKLVAGVDYPVPPPPKPPAKIDREAVDQLFGGNEGLDASITAYTLALKAHAKTVGVPAPIAHQFVEIIVKQHGGKYSVVEPPEPEPVPEPPAPEPEPPVPEKTLDEVKEEVRRALSGLRYQKVRDGVTYKGHEFYGDPVSVNALVSTLVATEGEANILIRWKGKKGDFAELERVDLQVLLKLIRKRTQACFDNEFLLAKKIQAANGTKAIGAIDFNAGWPE